MVLIILATLLVLGIALYQVMQGTFSTLIMAVLTTLCAVVAFAFYEPLASSFYSRQPAYADAASLMALFVVPLLILRMIVDRYCHYNVVLGVWTDRIFGGSLGIYVAMIMTGMLLIALQMLPLGGSFLYYRPYDADLKRDQQVVPFRSDEFTLWWIDTLSAGGLGVGKTYSSAHDEPLLELYCARNTAGLSGRVDASPKSISVENAFIVPDNVPTGHWSTRIPRNTRLPKNQLDRIFVIRVLISDRDRGKDNWWRLPATHFRLVSNKSKSYYPVAYLRREIHIPHNTSYQIVGETLEKAYLKPLEARSAESEKEVWPVPAPRTNQNNAPKRADLIITAPWKEEGGPKNLCVDWVYRLPGKEIPKELIFRRVARAEIKKPSDTLVPPIGKVVFAKTQ